MIMISRDVDAILIPSGANIYLPKGTEVVITQALGTSYTVNVYGNLVRIDGKDADALDKEIKTEDVLPENASLEDHAWAKLKTCYDPEIPVNIVDLGLIYELSLIPLGHDDHDIQITMTLTAPGCGMGPVLMEEVKQKLSTLSQVNNVNVELVFDPPWNQSMMSELAKLALGLM